MTTAAELRAMPMPQAVVAFLRHFATHEVGDIDGPWADEAMALFKRVNGITGWIADWERGKTKLEVAVAYDKAIKEAEARAS